MELRLTKLGSAQIAFLVLLLNVNAFVLAQLEMPICEEKTEENMMKAFCKNKMLKSVPQDLNHDIKVLDLSDNDITILNADEFKRYPKLQEIFLTRNRIDTISPHAFRGLGNVQKLLLDNNKLQHVPSEMFQHLRSIRYIFFKSNPIKNIAKDAFQYLDRIEEINFENCWLEHIHPLAFRGLEELYELNLGNNELTTLDAEMENALPESLRTLRMYSNNWMCNCSLRWLREYVDSKQIGWSFPYKDTACSGPPLIKSIKWDSLNAKQFACPARIDKGISSTNLQPLPGDNVTLEVSVFGDPAPAVKWYKNDQLYTRNGKVKEYKIETHGETNVKSVLVLLNVTRDDDEGDYKVEASNAAGTASVMYRVTLTQPIEKEVVDEEWTLAGLTKEALLGIIVGIVVLLIILIVLVVVRLKRRDAAKHAYRVRDYKKPAKGAKKHDSNRYIDEEEADLKEIQHRPKIPSAPIEHIVIAEEKELLDTKKKKVPTATLR